MSVCGSGDSILHYVIASCSDSVPFFENLGEFTGQEVRKGSDAPQELHCRVGSELGCGRAGTWQWVPDAHPATLLLPLLKKLGEKIR